MRWNDFGWHGRVGRTTWFLRVFGPAVLPDGVRLWRTLDDGRALLDLPRACGFRRAATALAQRGSHLVDIAGHRGAILVTRWGATRCCCLRARACCSSS